MRILRGSGVLMTDGDMIDRVVAAGSDGNVAEFSPRTQTVPESPPCDRGCRTSGDVDRMLSDFLLELNRLSEALGMREELSGAACTQSSERHADEPGHKPCSERPALQPPRYRNIDILLMEKPRPGERTESSSAEPPPDPPAPSAPPASRAHAGLSGRIRGLFRKF
jgi:hypothetical protein